MGIRFPPGVAVLHLLVDLGQPYISRSLNGIDELRELAVLKLADDLQAAPPEPA